ncbi:hypothetical protein ABMA28_007219 [Loxostege sticticalis]|uniref:Uncharacterized protein n=1 Tax=Loxostege sticticalis TaxID=481309 RepID=A0ABD0TPZ3_LOXSC
MLVELDCSDKVSYHNQIGYIKFNSPSTRFSNITWLVEVPPVLYTSPPIVRKRINGGELHWTRMDTRLPHDALIGGFENEPTYIARSRHNGSLCPGRYVPSKRAAFIPWGFHEHQKQNFEILCGFNAQWVHTKEDDIPQNAFIAGYSEVRREPLYIGRAMHLGHLLTGKVHTLYKSCYLPFDGNEIAVTSYEILVLPDV